MIDTKSEAISKLKNSKIVRGIGLTEDTVRSLVEEYHNLVIASILENGYYSAGENLCIEVVPITPRIHVLRNKTYRSTRRYKLKITIGDDIYKKIEESYDSLN